MGIQNGTVILQNSLAVSYKVKHTVTISSSNHIPWHLLKGAEKHIHAKTCTWMITIALLIIVKTGKEPRCSLVNEWVNCGAGQIIKRPDLKSSKKETTYTRDFQKDCYQISFRNLGS